MISSCKTKEEVVELSKTGQKLFSLVENSDRPVVAAINGSCLGGGLEVWETGLAAKLIFDLL